MDATAFIPCKSHTSGAFPRRHDIETDGARARAYADSEPSGRQEPMTEADDDAETPLPKPREPGLAQRLAHALSVLAQTLPNPWDESTDYFTPVAVEMPDAAPMTAESLHRPLGVGP